MNEKSLFWNDGAGIQGWGVGLVERLRRAGMLLRRWAARCAQRRRLARLDARLLKDIGITRAEALQEAHKPFWKP